MARKENNYYFDTFTKGAGCACDAVTLLKQCFDDFTPAKLPQRMDEMHKIEHTADEIKHSMMQQLVKEFLPPFEREDIIQLSNSIDDVTDSIEDILQQIYMLNISSIRPDVMAFAEVISKCCFAMKEMTLALPSFRKPTRLLQLVIEINHLEEEGDRLYINVMHQLYAQTKEPLSIITWSNIYSRLEKCCDCCEDVADVVEQIILKK